MRAWGSRYARLIFERCHRNKRAACAVLGISYHTLQAYLRYPFQEPARRSGRERLPPYENDENDEDVETVASVDASAPTEGAAAGAVSASAP
jgi:hypothetical protein